MPAPCPLKPIRLSQIPLQVRLHGARLAARQEPDLDERLAILTAALAPSDRTYWVPEHRAA